MKYGVVGLGLIGGSIFKKLRELNCDVVAVSASVKENNVSNDYSILCNCDLVFVCVPMNIILDILDKLQKYVSENTIVADVCSLKEFVSKREYKYKFIPSHPMAGTENSGWANSFPELFENATWAITPIKSFVDEYVDILEDCIVKLGAKPIITTPVEHDKAVALISHAPMLVAQAMCETIKDNKLAQILASSGFRDTTRLALSNVEMANDMVMMNKENIETSIYAYNETLNRLINSDYKIKAEQIKQFRQNLYS